MTKDDLQQIRELLDERDERLDKKLDTKLAEQDERLDKKLEENNAKLFGQLTRHFDDKLQTELEPLRAGFSNLQTTMDGIAKRLETDDQERAAISNQLDRHEAWIGQLADGTGVKLAPEQ